MEKNLKIENEAAFDALDQVIEGYKRSPVDLLDIGDEVGEYNYLLNARSSYQRTVQDVVELFAERQSRHGEPIKVLEIGAYLGVISVTLARLGFSVTALDIPEFMSNPRLQTRYRDEGVKTVPVNLKDYPLPLVSDHYDLVIMCETLEHLNFNPLPVLAEVNRVLRSGGQLYLALPNLASLPNRVNLMCGGSIHNPIGDFKQQLSRRGNMIVGLHWREYTRKELFELLSHVNFNVVEHSYLTVSASSLPAGLIYKVIPALRPAQVLMARKTKEVELDFHFTEATQS